MSNRIEDRGASKYPLTHVAILLPTLALGAASTAAAMYSVKDWAYGEFAVVIAFLVAASIAILPPFLAKVWGEAQFNTKHTMLVFSFMIMVCDGVLQLNLVRVVAELSKAGEVNYVVASLVVGCFQIAMFFLKGTVYTVTSEAEEDLARLRIEEAERLAEVRRLEAEEAEKEFEREKRRESYRMRRAATEGQHLQEVA